MPEGVTAEVVPHLETATAEEVLRYAVERFHPDLRVACSLQKEASVILDLVMGIEPETEVFILDTGVLFPETYATWLRVEEHYGIELTAHRGMTLAEQAARYGDELWNRDPDACCGIRKVTPLREALEGARAWTTGMRREQSPARAHTPKLQWDRAHSIWKVNPLADWTEGDVWRHIVEHDVPYHPLHDRGYESIGCTHCTVPGSDRAGRWAGRDKDECGIHDAATAA